MRAELRADAERSDLARLLADPRARPVTSPLFIANLLRAPGGRWMYAWDGGVRLAPPLRLEGLAFQDGRRVVRARFVDGVAPMTAGRRYDLVLAANGAVALFASTCLEQRGSTVLASLPTEVRQTGFRTSPRVTLDETWPVALELVGPDGSGRMAGPVCELGAGGFSFLLDGAGPRLRAGERLA